MIRQERSYRLSAVLTGFYPLSVTEESSLRSGLEAAADLGFDVVEFFHEGRAKPSVSSDVSALGLNSVYLAAYPMKKYGLDLGSPDKKARKAAVDTVKRLVDDARAYGSERVVLVSGPEIFSDGKRQDALAILEESVEALCFHAADASDPICIQIESFNNTGEPSLLLGPTLRSVEFSRIVRNRYSNFGLVLDLSHLVQLHENPLDSLETAGETCNHIHLANCVMNDRNHPLFGDKHPPFDFPQGAVEGTLVRAFVEKACSLSMQGNLRRDLIVGLEVIDREPEKPGRAMTEAKKYFDSLV